MKDTFHTLQIKTTLSNKEKWQELCNTEDSIPVFMYDWWMNIVCGKDNWDIALAFSSKGTIIGSMNYYKKKKWWLSVITVPPFTPFSGIWFKHIETDKLQSFHSTRKRIMSDIIEQIPHSTMLDIKLHYSNDNWLPFKWDGFKTSIGYTHTIDLRIPLDEIWNNFKGSTRSKINKYREHIIVEEIDAITQISPLIQSLLKFKNVGNSQHLSKLLGQIDQELKQRSQRKIWVAKNTTGEIEAYLYLIWDKQSAYYLTGGTHPNNRRTNAMYVLFWEAIQHSKTIVDTFDFEGSVIPNIEQVFKSFGARPRPYFKLSKTRSKLIDFARIVMNKNG